VYVAVAERCEVAHVLPRGPRVGKAPRWRTLLFLEHALADASHAARARGLDGLAGSYWDRVQVVRRWRREGWGRR
jgi:hypothetical protein